MDVDTMLDMRHRRHLARSAWDHHAERSTNELCWCGPIAERNRRERAQRDEMNAYRAQFGGPWA